MLLALFVTLALQDAREDVVLELADGGRLEYQVVRAADGSPIRDGDFRRENAAGDKTVQGKYSAGDRTGRWRFWHANGEPWALGRYKNDRRTGEWTFQDTVGKPIAKGEYDDGQMSGDWEFGGDWSSRSGTYEPVVETFGELGIEVRGAWLDGRPHGWWTANWPGGGRMLEGWFDRGRRMSSWRFHHADGTFDPKFVSGEGAPLSLPWVLAQDPYTPESDPQSSPPSSEAPLDPGAVPDLPHSHDEARTLIAALQAAQDESAGVVQQDVLVGLGRSVLPAVVNALCDLNFDDEDDRARAQALLKGVVEPVFVGHPLIGSAPSEDELRMAALRAHSLTVLTMDQSSWWELDLVLLDPRQRKPTEGEPEMTISPTLLLPPLFVNQLGQSTGGAKFGGRKELRKNGGSGTENALAEGLAWLARTQQPEGYWVSGLENAAGTPDEDFVGRHDQGITGLALLALLHDGNTLDKGPYRDNVVRATMWLIRQQDRQTGSFRTPFPMKADDGKTYMVTDVTKAYDHAIVTLALSRLARSSPSSLLRLITSSALDHIQGSRNPYAAWRYSAQPTGDNDTSITSWMVLALLEAEQAGFVIDPEALTGPLAWIDEVSDTTNGRIGYDTIGSLSARMAERNDHFPREKGEAMTAAGLACRFALGQEPAEHPIMAKHAELMRQNLPEWDPEGFGCDMYYWYYGTYAMFRMGGSQYWKPWNAALKRALVDSQIKAGAKQGSWDPVGPWGMVGGRTYSTALMCRCLQVYTSGLAPAAQR